MTLSEWKDDFKGFVKSLSMPRDDYKGIMEYIDEVPEPHWIPVTERLPEYGEDVLSITQDDVYEVNHVIDDVHDEWFWEDNGNVIAWMPLPEPYKGVTK